MSATGPAVIEPVIIELWIPGHPRTKGSHQPQQVMAGGRRTGRVRLVETPESQAWMKVLVDAIKKRLAAVPLAAYPALGEIGCRETYWVPFADSVDHRAGDVEKHVRQTHDALNYAGVWKDDAQCTLLIADKRSAFGTLHGPGVMLQAWIRRIF